jgi:hypothetical protein
MKTNPHVVFKIMFHGPRLGTHNLLLTVGEVSGGRVVVQVLPPGTLSKSRFPVRG